ncbi:hypothetical protein vseg_011294 [Gypsophila vaccaria]
MLIVLQIIVLSLVQVVSSREQIVFEGSVCRRSDNVSSTGVYRDNIMSLLNLLTDESSSSKFLNTSFGTGLDRVNGVFACRPDLPFATCESCVRTAVDRFNQFCQNKKQALAWYQQCMVRYTNDTISSTVQIEPSNSWSGLFNVSQPDTFPGKLNKTLEAIITEAATPGNEGHFAQNSTDFTIFEGLYGMAWCSIPHMTPSNCKTCLKTASSLMPNDGLAQTAVMFLANCILKYDVAPFIFSTSPTVLPPTASR